MQPTQGSGLFRSNMLLHALTKAIRQDHPRRAISPHPPIPASPLVSKAESAKILLPAWDQDFRARGTKVGGSRSASATCS